MDHSRHPGRVRRKTAVITTYITAATFFLAGCVDSVPATRVREGVHPQHIDDMVRFRTTYYFRVFDACEVNETNDIDALYDRAGGIFLRKKRDKKLKLLKDSLYRFTMTGKAPAYTSNVHFEAGTLKSWQIDPFGAIVDYDDQNKRFYFKSQSESRQEARLSELTRSLRQLKELREEFADTDEAKEVVDQIILSRLRDTDTATSEKVRRSLVQDQLYLLAIEAEKLVGSANAAVKKASTTASRAADPDLGDGDTAAVQKAALRPTADKEKELNAARTAANTQLAKIAKPLGAALSELTAAEKSLAASLTRAEAAVAVWKTESAAAGTGENKIGFLARSENTLRMFAPSVSTHTNPGDTQQLTLTADNPEFISATPMEYRLDLSDEISMPHKIKLLLRQTSGSHPRPETEVMVDIPPNTEPADAIKKIEDAIKKAVGDKAKSTLDIEVIETTAKSLTIKGKELSAPYEVQVTEYRHTFSIGKTGEKTPDEDKALAELKILGPLGPQSVQLRLDIAELKLPAKPGTETGSDGTASKPATKTIEVQRTFRGTKELADAPKTAQALLPALNDWFNDLGYTSEQLSARLTSGSDGVLILAGAKSINLSILEAKPLYQTKESRLSSTERKHKILNYTVEAAGTIEAGDSFSLKLPIKTTDSSNKEISYESKDLLHTAKFTDDALTPEFVIAELVRQASEIDGWSKAGDDKKALFTYQVDPAKKSQLKLRLDLGTKWSTEPAPVAESSDRGGPANRPGPAPSVTVTPKDWAAQKGLSGTITLNGHWEKDDEIKITALPRLAIAEATYDAGNKTKTLPVIFTGPFVANDTIRISVNGSEKSVPVVAGSTSAKLVADAVKTALGTPPDTQAITTANGSSAEEAFLYVPGLADGPAPKVELRIEGGVAYVTNPARAVLATHKIQEHPENGAAHRAKAAKELAAKLAESADQSGISMTFWYSAEDQTLTANLANAEAQSAAIRSDLANTRSALERVKQLKAQAEQLYSLSEEPARPSAAVQASKPAGAEGCSENAELRRGFQILGPEGVATFNQDDRLIMAMSSSARPLLSALQDISGRVLNQKASEQDRLLPLARERVRILQAEKQIAPIETPDQAAGMIRDVIQALQNPGTGAAQ
ncbi:hypothetical protein [Nisaea sp.]|uniref:hypothetical protein n=1 Tax=Nisaea sp. TaxID=2024842 RepID=UPI0032EB43A1